MPFFVFSDFSVGLKTHQMKRDHFLVKENDKSAGWEGFVNFHCSKLQ